MSKKKLVLVITIIVLAGLAACISVDFNLSRLFFTIFDPLSTSSPKTMFETLLMRPMPDGISDLQGGGYTWQGYSIWLRFKTSETALNTLLTPPLTREGKTPPPLRFRDRLGGVTPISQEPEYALVDCKEVLPHLELYSLTLQLRFWLTWHPDKVKNPVCYWTPTPFTNDWAYDGQNYLLIDRATGVVYFSGEGS